MGSGTNETINKFCHSEENEESIYYLQIIARSFTSFRMTTQFYYSRVFRVKAEKKYFSGNRSYCRRNNSYDLKPRTVWNCQYSPTLNFKKLLRAEFIIHRLNVSHVSTPI